MELIVGTLLAGVSLIAIGTLVRWLATRDCPHKQWGYVGRRSGGTDDDGPYEIHRFHCTQCFVFTDVRLDNPEDWQTPFPYTFRTGR